MTLYNCVMLDVMTSGLSSLFSDILNNYSHYINLDKVKECDWKSLVETDPHITLIYGLNPEVGYNTLYHLLKIKNRSEYLKIKKGTHLTISNPIIDTFDNEDCKVLKINFTNCDQYENLKNMMRKLCEIPNDWQYKDEYNPHLTLTYLNPDAPDSIATELTNKFSSVLTDFVINGYFISSDSGETSRF